MLLTWFASGVDAGRVSAGAAVDAVADAVARQRMRSDPAPRGGGQRPFRL